MLKAAWLRHFPCCAYIDGAVATATAKKDDSTTSPKTGASDVVPYAILVLSLAACGAAVFKLVKSK